MSLRGKCCQFFEHLTSFGHVSRNSDTLWGWLQFYILHIVLLKRLHVNKSFSEFYSKFLVWKKCTYSSRVRNIWYLPSEYSENAYRSDWTDYPLALPPPPPPPSTHTHTHLKLSALLFFLNCWVNMFLVHLRTFTWHFRPMVWQFYIFRSFLDT